MKKTAIALTPPGCGKVSLEPEYAGNPDKTETYRNAKSAEMKVESGISGRRDAVDWLVIESIAQKRESVNRYYHKFDIVLIWEMGPSGEFGGYDLEDTH